jgi:hypothetical protein
MSLIEKISRFLKSSTSPDESAYWISVRCNRCGEEIRSRVNLYNDLSVEYQGEGEQIYRCRKVLVGRKGCFQRIEVELVFDKNRRLIEGDISGGEFIQKD